MRCRRRDYTAAGSAAFCYDANGNLTADGASVYLYDVENRLVEKRAQGAGNTNCAALAYTGTLQAALKYDPTGRLYEVSGGTLGTQRFVYDGNALIAEYNSAGTMLRRYVHGSNVEADDPLIWYEGSAVSDASRRYLHTDPRGSIVAVTNYQGTATATNSYDEYGIPDSASGNDVATKGRFRYTGQAWIPELGMYYYKARIYSPTLGRFLQTDPIGYEDQFNLYAYVANDPINGVDPSGLFEKGDTLQHVNTWNAYSGGTPGLEAGANALGSVADRIKDGVLERGKGASDELKDELVTSWELGIWGEDWVVEQLEREGYTIIARNIYLLTVDARIRIADIAVKKDDQLTLVEVKVNGSRYTSEQKAKDSSIAQEGAWINPNSPAAERILGGGVPWIGPTETRVVRVRCRYAGWICRR